MAPSSTEFAVDAQAEINPLTWLAERLIKRILRRRSTPGDSTRLELAVALTLWMYLFLLIVTLVIGRSVGSALFLSRFDGRGLAINYVFVGLIVAALVSALQRLGKGRGTLSMAFVTLLVVLATTSSAGMVFSRLNLHNSRVVCGLFYLLVESFAFVTTVQFWAAANSALSLDQVRRLYVFIGTGGIAGSIAGGWLTRAYAKDQIVDALALITAVIPGQLLAIIVFAFLARRLQRLAQRR